MMSDDLDDLLDDIEIEDYVPIESDSGCTLSSIEEHAKTKGMWAGALKPCAIQDLFGATIHLEPMIVDEGEESAFMQTINLIEITRAHTPALLKIFDEIIVNASDHAKDNENAKTAANRVSKINISFDKLTGRFTVYNNGPGVPIKIHPSATAKAGKDIYIPEVAFSYFLAGTSIHKSLDNVKGGINGLGAKLANVHSTEFQLETVDDVNKKYYSQQWRNRLSYRAPPIIIDLSRKASTTELTTEQKKSHTQVSFIPAYVELGYPAYTPEIASDLDAWLCLRSHQTAAYVGSKVTVTYNGFICKTQNAAELGKIICEDNDGAIIMNSAATAKEEPYKKHPINVAVIILPSGKKAGRRVATQNMGIVNGVICNKGPHFKHIKGLLSDAIEDKVRKATKRSTEKPKAATTAKATTAKAATKAADKKMSVTETLSGVKMVISCAIPGADWTGQRKDELALPKGVIDKYTLPATFLKSVAEAVTERLLMAQGAKTDKVVHDKYIKAHNAGKAANKQHTKLLAAEGDSAITLLKKGLTQQKKTSIIGGPSYDWFGIISLQGVIVNAAREVTELETSGGEIVNVRSAKLQNNKRLLALADAFGLSYDKTYATEKELATLNYGQLILCVDQDLDGTGKIAALVLVWIYLFWPNLIKAGKIGRFMTPLIRAYPKTPKNAKPIEFFYEDEFKHWLKEDPTRSTTHHINYYKGLAGHDDDEVKFMFEPTAFKRSIYTYTMDETAKRLFEVYFGVDPALRKEVLVKPVEHLSYEDTMELHRRREIPVGRVQLDVDTKSYKNDAIKRQIAGGPDGLNPARRKIIMGAIMCFKTETSPKGLKIFQFGGFVAHKCFYHHGDASLSSTITYLAQSFTGARKYPYLIGVGQFGSRHGDKAGSARYISVKISPMVKATFPSADRWHLPYVFEDGERAEPQYFMPVVPMAALESYRIVSEGWNHDSHGRDMASVLAIVKAYIAGDEDLIAVADMLAAEGPTAVVMKEIDRLTKKWPLPCSSRDFDGDFRDYRGGAYSFGQYTWNADKRTIVITELPIGTTTEKYLETLSKPGRAGKANPRAEFIESISDRSGSDNVELQIVLRPGAFEEMQESFGDATIDPIEDALMLRASLKPHLNYYSATGAVLEFRECYLASILYWAPLRRELYKTRLTRKAIVAELRITEESEILRYISMAAELNLSEIDDDAAAEACLQTNSFPRLDVSLLHSPEYTPNSELRSAIMTGHNASYGYILNLKERELVKSAAELRRKRVVALQKELAEVQAQLAESPIAGGSVWKSELENFEATVARGISSKWKFK